MAEGVLLLAQKQALELVVAGAQLREVLSLLARIVEKHADGKAVASILLLDSAGALRAGAGPGLPEEYLAIMDGHEAGPAAGTAGTAALWGKVAIAPEIDTSSIGAPLGQLLGRLGLKASWSQPIVDGGGRVLGTFNTFFREPRAPSDVERHLVGMLSQTAALAIERKRDEEIKEQQTRVLDTAIDAAEMGTWRYTFADEICLCSPRAVELYGLDGAEWLHDAAGVARVLHPEDVPRMWRKVGEATDPAGNGRYNIEYRVRRRGGGWRWLSVWGVVEFDGDGPFRRAVAMIGASRDVTAEKEAERQQELLINELNHRVKNTLAVIQSISSQTLRSTADPEEFHETFSARIAALARAHGLLTRTLWQEVGFAEIADVTLSPYADGRRDDRVLLDGPSVTIPASTAVTLSLMLHELATNAMKHGSLSSPDGRIDLRWRRPDGAGSELEVLWLERGGPPVAPPTRQGLGSKLIAASAEQLGGRLTADFRPEGLECRFVFELPA